MNRREEARRPSASLVISVIALFVSIGGIGYAAAKIGSSDLENGAVTAKKLDKNSVTTKKIKDDAVTGAKAQESSFAAVPSAASAANAAALGGSPPSAFASSSLEAVHRVGAAGQPVFQNSWDNEGGGFETVGFYKDSLGIIHLVGDAHNAAAPQLIFTLPGGYRPASIIDFFVRANGDTAGATVIIEPDGSVRQFGYAGGNRLQLNGITFRP
jgi:hypothetical protein